MASRLVHVGRSTRPLLSPPPPPFLCAAASHTQRTQTARKGEHTPLSLLPPRPSHYENVCGTHAFSCPYLATFTRIHCFDDAVHALFVGGKERLGLFQHALPTPLSFCANNKILFLNFFSSLPRTPTATHSTQHSSPMDKSCLPFSSGGVSGRKISAAAHKQQQARVHRKEPTFVTPASRASPSPCRVDPQRQARERRERKHATTASSNVARCVLGSGSNSLFFGLARGEKWEAVGVQKAAGMMRAGWG